jgi:hypothetical protein
VLDDICSAADCICPAHSRGWCQAHYARWARNGDPLAGRYPHRCAPRLCAIEGCSRRHHSGGFCQKHSLRWVNSGGDIEVTTLDGVRPGALNGKWGADDVGYEAVHRRLDRARGNAQGHSCATCGEPAADWAYDHSDPSEKATVRRGREYSYSTDLSHYLPLCRSCHTRLDKGLDHMEAPGLL